MHYRIMEVGGWIIVNPSGRAENNEPLRVKYLFNKWLTMDGIRVIINLKELAHFGVWEVGLLTSFQREVKQRNGVLRLCHLRQELDGYFHNDRFQEQFEIYPNLEEAMQGGNREWS